jgi:hypothetical protein
MVTAQRFGDIHEYKKVRYVEIVCASLKPRTMTTKDIGEVCH